MVTPTKRIPKNIQNKATGDWRSTPSPESRSGSTERTNPIDKRRTATELPKSRHFVPERKRTEGKRSRKVRPSGRPVVLRTPQDSMTVEVAINDSVKSSHLDVSVPTLLIYFSFCVGVVIALIHVTDFLFEWPFHRFYIAQDVAFFLCGTALAWLSWSTLKERRH